MSAIFVTIILSLVFLYWWCSPGSVASPNTGVTPFLWDFRRIPDWALSFLRCCQKYGKLNPKWDPTSFPTQLNPRVEIVFSGLEFPLIMPNILHPLQWLQNLFPRRKQQLSAHHYACMLDYFVTEHAGTEIQFPAHSSGVVNLPAIEPHQPGMRLYLSSQLSTKTLSKMGPAVVPGKTNP